MKTILVVLSLAMFFPLSAIGGGKSVRVSIENPSDFERTHETVALSLKDLREKLKDSDVGGFVVLETKSSIVLISQITENELLFQSDFKPGERKEFVVEHSSEKRAKPQSLVDGGFELPREDYAWENDRIAFRMYGPAMAKDVNNGIDVWCKRVKYLIVDKWYSASAAAGKDTYHEDHGEGADFFSVGKSLGAGGSGIWRSSKVIQPGVFSSQKTICNGPIRVTFELTYSNWNVDGKQFTERKRISLDAGQNLNRIDVTFENLVASDSSQIACGLVKRTGTAITTDPKNGWMSLWGLTTKDTVNGFLGTAVIVPSGLLVQFTEDKDQHLLIGKLDGNSHFSYYAGAGWTHNEEFLTEADWTAYLTKFARTLQAPLKIIIE